MSPVASPRRLGERYWTSS